MQKLADRIRKHVVEEYVRPARGTGNRSIRVRAGDVHRALGLNNQVPAVCGALDARKFQDLIGARSVARSGPHQGTTAEWQIELPTESCAQASVTGSPIPAVWEGGHFRPLGPLELLEGQQVTLFLSDEDAPAAIGGRFASFAGTLLPEEAREMQQELSREFGRIEGEW